MRARRTGEDVVDLAMLVVEDALADVADAVDDEAAFRALAVVTGCYAGESVYAGCVARVDDPNEVVRAGMRALLSERRRTFLDRCSMN